MGCLAGMTSDSIIILLILTWLFSFSKLNIDVWIAFNICRRRAFLSLAWLFTSVSHIDVFIVLSGSGWALLNPTRWFGHNFHVDILWFIPSCCRVFRDVGLNGYLFGRLFLWFWLLLRSWLTGGIFIVLSTLCYTHRI